MEERAPQNDFFFITFVTFTSTLFVVCLASNVQILFPLWDGGVTTPGNVVQTNISPTISFFGIHRKSFIYRRNRTNYQ